MLKPWGAYGTPLAYHFTTIIPAGDDKNFTDIIRFTYQEEGAAPVVFENRVFTGAGLDIMGRAAIFAPIHRTGRPVPTTLTIDLLRSAPDFVIPGGPQQGQSVDSYTYSFQTVAPVPEPSTLVLLASGAVGLATRLRRRRNNPAPS